MIRSLSALACALTLAAPVAAHAQAADAQTSAQAASIDSLLADLAPDGADFDAAAQPVPPEGLAASVQADGDTAGDVYDPWERANRGLFRVHKTLDRTVVRPVARGYGAVTPRPVRKGVRNFVSNLGEPLTFINAVLQGKPTRAGTTATRFITNSTVGVAGLFDPATKLGVPIVYEDFGQTLGRWGVPQGPFIFVPVLGPSSLRDGSGRFVDYVVNPVGQVQFEGDTAVRTGLAVAYGLDTRNRIDGRLQALEQSSTDEYATLRSAYVQNRAAQVRDGVTDVADLPDFGEPTPVTPTRRP